VCPESRENYAWSRDGGAWGRKNDRSDVDLVPSMSLPSANEVFFGTQIQHHECLDAITKRRSASQQLARRLLSKAMLASTILSLRHEFLKCCTNADGALANDAHRAAHSHFFPSSLTFGGVEMRDILCLAPFPSQQFVTCRPTFVDEHECVR
jgi:hypothetical protein